MIQFLAKIEQKVLNIAHKHCAPKKTELISLITIIILFDIAHRRKA
jgi:hypothetical protein